MVYLYFIFVVVKGARMSVVEAEPRHGEGRLGDPPRLRGERGRGGGRGGGRGRERGGSDRYDSSVRSYGGPPHERARDRSSERLGELFFKIMDLKNI